MWSEECPCCGHDQMCSPAETALKCGSCGRIWIVATKLVFADIEFLRNYVRFQAMNVQHQLLLTRGLKDRAIKEGEFARAAELRDHERRLRNSIFLSESALAGSNDVNVLGEAAEYMRQLSLNGCPDPNQEPKGDDERRCKCGDEVRE